MDENMINDALGFESAEGSQTEPDTTSDNQASTQSAENSDAGTAATTPDAGTMPGDGDDGNAAGTGVSDGHTQTPEENSRYAAARRAAEAERDRAIAAERERSAREADSLIASLGMVNPYTGQAINSKAEYDAYTKARAGEAKKTFMEQSGISESQYQQMIQSLPEVQEAMKARAESERVAAEYRSMQARSRLEEQVKEVTKLDPSIKSIDDLAKMENYDVFYDLVKKGNSLADAYKLANYDKLMERSAAAEKQRNLNAAAGKSHFTPNANTIASGLDEVPASTKEYYKIMFPDMSEEQIAKEYARFAKNK